MTGEIPPELGRLSNLTELGLSYNQLTGEIPPALGHLTNLTALFLFSNQLTGEIPPELGGLSNLTWLVLYDNQLTGEIPPELGRLTNLTRLVLSTNQLTGEIPPELGGLSNLTELWLHSNRLTGCIPEGLRAIEDNDLDDLVLPFCDLLLARLDISPGTLTPVFDPSQTDYFAEVGPPPVTVTATTEQDATIRFLDENDGEITDADGTLGGLQIDLGDDVTTIKIEVESQDQTAASVYTIRISSEGSVGPILFPDAEGSAISETVRNVAENTAAGENVGAPVEATHTEGDTLTYTLSGADASLFAIDSGTGQIKLGAGTTLDYGAGANYSVDVTATAASRASATITVTITVTDVDLGPLGSRYDADKNRAIDKDEAIAAVADYFAGRLTKEKTIGIIVLYFSSGDG